MTLSQARQKLRRLVTEQVKLLTVLLARKHLIKGGVYLNKTRCGKPNCKCVREGILHTSWKLYWTEDGKTQQQTLKKSEVAYYQKLTKNYMRFRKARARMVKIHQEMMKLINLLEKGMTKSSVKRYSGRRSR